MSERTDLEGRVAVVTGGGAAGDGIGNGRAASIVLARDGAKVLVVDRDVELARRTVEMIEAEGGEGLPHEADVTRSDDAAGLVAAAVDAWGRLDVLVNNVGVGSRGTVVTESEERWGTVMRVNVDSMMLCSRHAVPAMVASGDGGAIVNISSIAAFVPRGLTAYSTSKGAVIALTKAMAVDHAPDGIRVNCVAPGPVYTPLVIGEGMTEAARDARRRASLLQIEGTGWDVGHAVDFLCSPRARYITGQTLTVDGGVSLKGPERDPSSRGGDT